MRDPFVHARNAALLALAATADLFSEEDCATKLLPIMCPSLVDKEKLIRDQAQKSVDIYIARIRKHAATMPDTVLPPSGVAAAGGGATPRIGTPANEAGWAGWAISSFTNKLASTSGTISSNGGGGAADTRSSSVPPTASSKPPVPLASKPGMTLHTAKSSANVPTIKSPSPAAAFNDEAEDFDGDWGGFDDAAGSAFNDNEDEQDDDPWGTPSVAKPSTTTTTTTTSFDDKGEPDFAGWLAAQNQSKKVAAKPLPKGLAKSSAKKSVIGGGGGGVGGVARPNAQARKVVQPLKKEAKVEPKKDKEDEIEGWGDDW